MKINAEITPDSYIKFQKTLNSLIVKPKENLRIGIIFAILFITPLLFSVYYQILWGLVFVLYILIIFLVLGNFVIKKSIKTFSSLGNSNYGTWSFELEDSGLRIINNEHFNKFFYYNAFIDAFIKNDLLVILIGPQSGIHIPITEANRSDIQEFLNTLKNHIKD